MQRCAPGGAGAGGYVGRAGLGAPAWGCWMASEGNRGWSVEHELVRKTPEHQPGTWSGGRECRRGVVRYNSCELAATCAREPGDRYPCCRKSCAERPESIWSVGLRVVPFTFVPVSARVPACQMVSETLGHRDSLRVAERLAVWTLSLRSPDSDGCGLLTCETVLPWAEGQARHTRPRGSEESRNSQVRRVETAGNRRNSDSPLSARNRESRW